MSSVLIGEPVSEYCKQDLNMGEIRVHQLRD